MDISCQIAHAPFDVFAEMTVLTTDPTSDPTSDPQIWPQIRSQILRPDLRSDLRTSDPGPQDLRSWTSGPQILDLRFYGSRVPWIQGTMVPYAGWYMPWVHHGAGRQAGSVPYAQQPLCPGSHACQ